MYQIWFTLLVTATSLAFVAGPIALVALLDWRRRRDGETAARQIALTDALDARLGPIVAPVIRRGWWGPWQVELSASLAPVRLARVLAITQQTLGDQDGRGRAYQIVLTPAQTGARRPLRSHWTARRIAA